MNSSKHPILLPNLKTAEDKATVEARITLLEDSGPVELQTDVATLQTEVETATTGLLDRATALEARAAFFSGSGAPGTISGQKTGDLYLDSVAGAFYLRGASSWTEIGTLTAP